MNNDTVNSNGEAEENSGSAAKAESVGLVREDWDFSQVPAEEWMPALVWEMNRECDTPWNAEGRMKNEERKRGCIPALSAAVQMEAGFGADISLLVRAFPTPWLYLPPGLRRLLAGGHEERQAARIVAVGDLPKGDAVLPLEAGSPTRTPLVLMINWEHSLKKIMGATAGILKRLQPQDVMPRQTRGRKKRNVLVALERLAITRLLHHYTLSEIKRELPDAWRLYQNRKWYYERRRALEVFRSIVRAEGKPFPRSWATRGQRRGVPGK